MAKAIVPGRAGTKNESLPGSVSCHSLCTGLVVDMAIKNEEMRAAVAKDPSSILEKIFAGRANSVLSLSESNPLHSLFLPRFVYAQPRLDKTTADTLEQVKAQFAAAVAT